MLSTIVSISLDCCFLFIVDIETVEPLLAVLAYAAADVDEFDVCSWAVAGLD